MIESYRRSLTNRNPHAVNRNTLINYAANVYKSFAVLPRVGNGIGEAVFNPCLDGYERAIAVLEDVQRASTIFQILAGPFAGIRGAVSGSTITSSKVDALLSGEADHIVLGIEAEGLKETAVTVGGRHLLRDPNWRVTLQNGLQDRNTRFTISLDGVFGKTAYAQFMSAARHGASAKANPFTWEMSEVLRAGRHVDATFVREGGTIIVRNPFGP